MLYFIPSRPRNEASGTDSSEKEGHAEFKRS